MKLSILIVIFSIVLASKTVIIRPNDNLVDRCLRGTFLYISLCAAQTTAEVALQGLSKTPIYEAQPQIKFITNKTSNFIEWTSNSMVKSLSQYLYQLSEKTINNPTIITAASTIACCICTRSLYNQLAIGKLHN